MPETKYTAPGPKKHALVTGPIQGFVATPSGDVDDDYVDVTPEVLYFDNQKTAMAVAESIEDAHWERDTHPIQVQAREIAQQPDISDEEKKQHAKLFKEVETRVTKRVAAYPKGSGK
jgi:hypothetical protein